MIGPVAAVFSLWHFRLARWCSLFIGGWEERRGESGASFGWRRRFRFYGSTAAMAELGGQLGRQPLATARASALTIVFAIPRARGGAERRAG